MREISQRIFDVFDRHYIRPRLNLFDMVDALSLRDITGRFSVFVEQERASGRVTNLDLKVAYVRSKLKGFTIYQLGASTVNFGVPCGYYDPQGKQDEKKIATRVNDYLFNVCFNPEIQQKNYEHFLDYLLLNLTSTGRHEFVPTMIEFTKVLNRNQLASYWTANAEAIRGSGFEKFDKEIIGGSYKAYYKTDLAPIYRLLDELISGEQNGA